MGRVEGDGDGWPRGVMKGLWDRAAGADGRGAPATPDKRYTDGKPLRGREREAERKKWRRRIRRRIRGGEGGKEREAKDEGKRREEEGRENFVRNLKLCEKGDERRRVMFS